MKIQLVLKLIRCCVLATSWQILKGSVPTYFFNGSKQSHSSVINLQQHENKNGLINRWGWEKNLNAKARKAKGISCIESRNNFSFRVHECTSETHLESLGYLIWIVVIDPMFSSSRLRSSVAGVDDSLGALDKVGARVNMEASLILICNTTENF